MFIIFIKEFNIPIQPKQLPSDFNDQTNLEINQYVFESKCKKIVTVTTVFSPSNIYVVLEDHNTNVSILIDQFYLILIIIVCFKCFNNLSLTIVVYALYSLDNQTIY